LNGLVNCKISPWSKINTIHVCGRPDPQGAKFCPAGDSNTLVPGADIENEFKWVDACKYENFFCLNGFVNCKIYPWSKINTIHVCGRPGPQGTKFCPAGDSNTLVPGAELGALTKKLASQLKLFGLWQVSLQSSLQHQKV
jgi:hypothetical protein